MARYLVIPIFAIPICLLKKIKYFTLCITCIMFESCCCLLTTGRLCFATVALTCLKARAIWCSRCWLPTISTLALFYLRQQHFVLDTSLSYFVLQVADALATPFVGYESDRINGFCGYGKRKSWHLLVKIILYLFSTIIHGYYL